MTGLGRNYDTKKNWATEASFDQLQTCPTLSSSEKSRGRAFLFKNSKAILEGQQDESLPIKEEVL